MAHVDSDTGKLVAELPDGTRLPEAVLEELACNARLTGVVFDRKGKPIWRTESCRTATEAQRQILIARYGGCFHCKAHPALCQIHHIRPVSQGGSTRLDNMVPVCWDCHQRIHHHQWQIRTTGGVHTLHPPGWMHHGPAHAPEQPSLHLPGTEPAAGTSPDRHSSTFVLQCRTWLRSVSGRSSRTPLRWLPVSRPARTSRSRCGGRPVARMTAIASSRLEELVSSGLARAARRDIAELPPPPEGPELSQELDAMRTGERF